MHLWLAVWTSILLFPYHNGMSCWKMMFINILRKFYLNLRSSFHNFAEPLSSWIERLGNCWTHIILGLLLTARYEHWFENTQENTSVTRLSLAILREWAKIIKYISFHFKQIAESKPYYGVYVDSEQWKRTVPANCLAFLPGVRTTANTVNACS